jgi:hypothetical protein
MDSASASRGRGVRGEFRRIAGRAGVRRRFAPHQLRHAHALERAREGVPLNNIQRQLGHANLGMTSIYLQGIDPEEILAAVRARRAPMMSASAGCNSEQQDRRAEAPQRSRFASRKRGRLHARGRGSESGKGLFATAPRSGFARMQASAAAR